MTDRAQDTEAIRARKRLIRRLACLLGFHIHDGRWSCPACGKYFNDDPT